MQDRPQESALFPGAHPAPMPADEPARLAALQGLKLLDSLPEAAFDDIVRLASLVCGTPIALVSLVDAERQWFKARVGLAATETHRDLAFCAHAINKPQPIFEIPDASADARFADNPLVTGDPHIRFYAGTPLLTPEGHAIGTLCVIDRVPHRLDAAQREALAALGRRVMSEVQLRQQLSVLDNTRSELEAARQLALEQSLSLQQSVDALRTSGQALQASKRELEYFKLIAEGTEDFVALAGLDRKVLYVNPAGRAAFGLASMEAVQQTELLDYIFPDALGKATGEWLPSLLRDGYFNVEIDGRHFVTGAVVPMLWRAFLIKDPETGQPYAVAAMGPLLAERRRIEAERLAQQQALAESEARYRQLSDENPAILLRCRNAPGWPALDISKAIERISGHAPEEFTKQGLLFGSLIVEDDLPQLLTELATQEAAGGEIKLRYRLRHKDGSLRWISSQARATTLADGQPGYYAAVSDVTEQRLAELALADSENRYRRLADNSPAIIFRCRNQPGWPALYMSRATPEITGYPVRAFVDEGLLFGSLIPEEERALVQQRTDEQLAVGDVVRVEYRIRHRDGGLRWIVVNARRLTLPDGGDGYEGTITDISSGKEAERLLALRAQALERAQIATQAAAIAPYTWYIDSDRLEIGPLAEAMHGLAPGEYAGSLASLLQRVHPDDQETLSQHMLRTLTDGKPDFHLEYRTVAADGRVRWLRSVGRLIPDDGELRSSGAVLDATAEVEALRELETRSRALERANAELDEFTYVASHDLKEPLRGIHNYARFLAEDYAAVLDDGGQQMLKVVSEQAERMQRLIDDLMHIARLGREPVQQAETNLDALVDEVLASLAFSIAEKKVHVERQPLGRVVCSRARMAEVYRNLITNAIKYNDNASPAIEIGRLTKGDRTVFFVRDNGIGIKPEFHARVFAPFKRLHTKTAYGGGTGVGLTIVKRIIEAHDGEIHIESSLGQGSSFLFSWY